MQMILGGIYTWSTLTGYLHDEFGITNGESAFIFLAVPSFSSPW
jgi:hypothetical protein